MMLKSKKNDEKVILAMNLNGILKKCRTTISGAGTARWQITAYYLGMKLLVLITNTYFYVSVENVSIPGERMAFSINAMSNIMGLWDTVKGSYALKQPVFTNNRVFDWKEMDIFLKNSENCRIINALKLEKSEMLVITTRQFTLRSLRIPLDQFMQRIRLLAELWELTKSDAMDSIKTTINSAKSKAERHLRKILKIPDKNERAIALSDYLAMQTILSDTEKYCWMVDRLNSDVHEGGFLQFFYNNPECNPGEVVIALNEMSAFKTIELLNAAMKARDDETRLSELSDKFFSSEEDLEELMFKYLQRKVLGE